MKVLIGIPALVLVAESLLGQNKQMTSNGQRAICIACGHEANCQPFTLHGDTPLWGQGSAVGRFRHLLDSA